MIPLNQEYCQHTPTICHRQPVYLMIMKMKCITIIRVSGLNMIIFLLLLLPAPRELSLYCLCISLAVGSLAMKLVKISRVPRGPDNNDTYIYTCNTVTLHMK